MYTLAMVSHLLMFFVMLVVLAETLKERTMAHFRSRPFLWLLAFNLLMLASGVAVWCCLERLQAGAGSRPLRLLYVLVSCLAFLSFYALLSAFVYCVVNYISRKKPVSLWWAHATLPVCAFFACCSCLSLFNGMFYVVQDGLLSPGRFYAFSGMGGYFVVLVTLCLLFRYRRCLKASDGIFMLSFVVLPLLVQVVLPLRMWCFMQTALSFSILCIYCFIHLQLARLCQQQETKLVQDRIAILLSQISPHFIFNVLNTVYVLCDSDTARAKQALGDFSNYLRANLESLESGRTVPFQRELATVRHYLNLEQLRFQDDLHVSYDIQSSDFELPPLTLQPLVENAVKHGLMKKGGGRVAVGSRKAGDVYEITVRDDGSGFPQDGSCEGGEEHGGEHVGLSNVRERLRILSGGSLQVESIPGAGTTVIMRIPAQGGRGCAL